MKKMVEIMIDVYGYEKVEHWLMLNYFFNKYMGNNEEADTYKKLLSEISAYDPRWEIALKMGEEIQSQQLIEEMAELTQALVKLNRIKGNGQPVAPNLTMGVVMDNLVEELADVKLVLDEMIFLLGINEQIEKLISIKVNRTLDRIEKAGGRNEKR